jgi:hypothetical protein
MPGPFYFAWVGGQMPAAQTLLATRGDTHGAVLSTISITGDIANTQRTILNVGNIGALSIGALYGIEGPGVSDVVVYDGGNLLELSSPATATITQATFVLTAAIDVLNTNASITAGNVHATLADISGLELGAVHGIAGAGFAQGSTFVFAGSADIVLSLAPLDTFNPVAVTISAVSPRAPFLIDGIEDLSPLTPGLTYNIGGPGIPDGAGFVAPASGNAITIDVPTTDTRTLGPLVITGPRLEDGGGFSTDFVREDDTEIVRISIEQEEGDFAVLTIETRNPFVGLLAPGREIWGWLSWDDGTGNIVPLFHGRLVGLPSDLIGERIELKFIAQPNDFAAQKLTLAESMKVAPYWDPVWLQPRLADPDAVLESYSALWHVDRVTLVVTASDIIIGEDGTIEIGQDDHLYEPMTTAIAQPPQTSIILTGTVTWLQTAGGTIDFTRKICSAFQAGGSPYAYPLICTLTGDGLKGSWPAPGTSIGGGWSVADTNSLVTATPRQSLLNYSYSPVLGFTNGWITPYEYKVTYTAQLQATPTQTFASQFFQNWGTFTLSFPLTVFQILFAAQYSAARKRTETVTATMFADLQPVLTDAAKGEDTIELNSEYVGLAVDDDGSIPIGDLRSPSYFKTDRGAQSFEYMLLLGRAKLRYRARCFDIAITVPWSIAIQATCRKTVQLTDYRLPGGAALGKIKHYAIVIDDQGARGELTLACCIGRGSTVTEDPGVGDYAGSGYMQTGYQRMSGAQLSVVEGELVYQTFDDFGINDDGVDLFNMNADTCLLNYTTSDIPAVGFSVSGELTQGSTVVSNLSDLSGFIAATTVVKSRTFGVKGTGIPLGSRATYSDGKLTLSNPANFFPGRPLGSIPSVGTQTVSIAVTGSHLNSGIVEGGLRDQVNAIRGVGVVIPPISTGGFLAHQFGGGLGGITTPGALGIDPIGGISQMPTVITLDLPDLTAEFATSFAPQVQPLALPKTIDLEAS